MNTEIFDVLHNLCNNVVKSCDEKTRKNADYQWSELVPFLILKNKIRSKKDITFELVESYNIDVRYYYDLYDAKDNEVNDYIMNFYTETNYNHTTKKFELFEDTASIKDVLLTGKKITSLKNEHKDLYEKIESVDEKDRKGDLFILLDTNKLIGISIKKDNACQITNWSIEKIMDESSYIFDVKPKDIRKQILDELCPYEIRKKLSTKEKRDTVQDKYELMKDTNNIMRPYKVSIDNFINSNTDYIRNVFIEGVAQKNDLGYELYTFNGETMKSNNIVYDYLVNKKDTIQFICDDSTFKNNNSDISNYSKSAAKMWYFISVDNEISYRCEIRWKGDCDASPQMLIFHCNVKEKREKEEKKKEKQKEKQMLGKQKNIIKDVKSNVKDWMLIYKMMVVKDALYSVKTLTKEKKQIQKNK